MKDSKIDHFNLKWWIYGTGQSGVFWIYLILHVSHVRQDASALSSSSACFHWPAEWRLERWAFHLSFKSPTISNSFDTMCTKMPSFTFYCSIFSIKIENRAFPTVETSPPGTCHQYIMYEKIKKSHAQLCRIRRWILAFLLAQENKRSTRLVCRKSLHGQEVVKHVDPLAQCKKANEVFRQIVAFACFYGFQWHVKDWDKCKEETLNSLSVVSVLFFTYSAFEWKKKGAPHRGLSSKEICVLELSENLYHFTLAWLKKTFWKIKQTPGSWCTVKSSSLLWGVIRAKPLLCPHCKIHSLQLGNEQICKYKNLVNCYS